MPSNFKTIGLLLAGFLAHAAWAQSEPLPFFRGDVTYASRYVFRGLERAGASAQASAEFAQDNLRGGVTSSVPFQSRERRAVNLHAAYAWQPGEQFTLEASLRHEWFDRLPPGGTRRTCEVGLSATLATPIKGFTPRVDYFRDFRLDADTWQLSFARSVALTHWGAFLDFNFFAGSSRSEDWQPDRSGATGRDQYAYWGAEVYLPYRIGAHSTFIGGLHYTDKNGHSVANGAFSQGGRQKGWLTLGISLDF